MLRVRVDAEGHWIWTGCRTMAGPLGYGRFSWDAERRILAHRAAYEMFVGPVPENLELDHLCRVRDCVNPAHLEPVTHQENVRRAQADYCKNCGGELVRVSPGQQRICRPCRARRGREYRARLKARAASQ